MPAAWVESSHLCALVFSSLSVCSAGLSTAHLYSQHFAEQCDPLSHWGNFSAHLNSVLFQRFCFVFTTICQCTFEIFHFIKLSWDGSPFTHGSLPIWLLAWTVGGGTVPVLSCRHIAAWNRSSESWDRVLSFFKKLILRSRTSQGHPPSSHG